MTGLPRVGADARHGGLDLASSMLEGGDVDAGDSWTSRKLSSPSTSRGRRCGGEVRRSGSTVSAAARRRRRRAGRRSSSGSLKTRTTRRGLAVSALEQCLHVGLGTCRVRSWSVNSCRLVVLAAAADGVVEGDGEVDWCGVGRLGRRRRGARRPSRRRRRGRRRHGRRRACPQTTPRRPRRTSSRRRCRSRRTRRRSCSRGTTGCPSRMIRSPSTVIAGIDRDAAGLRGAAAGSCGGTVAGDVGHRVRRCGAVGGAGAARGGPGGGTGLVVLAPAGSSCPAWRTWSGGGPAGAASWLVSTTPSARAAAGRARRQRAAADGGGSGRDGRPAARG